MARLFANSNEEDQVQDLNNVESAVAVDGPEEVKDDLQDPVEETALESYKDIKEAVEEALETQDEIQEQIENSEQVLETNPEGVTEEVIQDAQECLVASLSKLGLSRDQISKYRISSESCKTNAERLQATVKKLRLAQETIRRSLKGAIAESYKVTDRKFGISQEYTHIDWAQSIGGFFNTIWRGLTNKSKTKIEKPGLLLAIIVGQYNSLSDGLIGAIKKVYDAKKGKGQNLSIGKNLIMANNVYEDVIVNYKKVKPEDYSKYTEKFTKFKSIVNAIKTGICVSIPEREMSTSEINEIKYFKPEKAKKEIESAIAYLKNKDEKLGKLAEDIAEFVSKNVIEFIAKNTIID